MQACLLGALREALPCDDGAQACFYVRACTGLLLWPQALGL
jgi:hypothetical protein